MAYTFGMGTGIEYLVVVDLINNLIIIIHHGESPERVVLNCVNNGLCSPMGAVHAIPTSESSITVVAHQNYMHAIMHAVMRDL